MREVMYKKIASYIIDNRASKKDTCKKFGITKRVLKDHMKTVRNSLPIIYDRAVDTFNSKPSRRGDLPVYLQIAQYVTNRKASREQVIKRFDLDEKSLYDAMRYLRKKNETMYNRVVSMMR